MSLTRRDTHVIKLVCDCDTLFYDSDTCVVSTEITSRTYSEAVHEAGKAGWVHVQLFRPDGAERHPPGERPLLCPACANRLFPQAYN